MVGNPLFFYGVLFLCCFPFSTSDVSLIDSLLKAFSDRTSVIGLVWKTPDYLYSLAAKGEIRGALLRSPTVSVCVRVR